MKKAHKAKKEKKKEFLKFECPYKDALNGTPCGKKYFSFKYEGAQEHLANCLHYDATVFQAYVKEKGIKIDTWSSGFVYKLWRTWFPYGFFKILPYVIVGARHGVFGFLCGIMCEFKVPTLFSLVFDAPIRYRTEI